MSKTKLIKNMNDFILGCIMLVFGLFIFLNKGIIKNNVATNTGGMFARADVYIRMLAGLIAFLAFLLIIKAINFSKSKEVKGFRFVLNKEIALTALSLIIYTYVLPRIGFAISTSILMFLLVLMLSVRELTGGERKVTKKELYKLLLISLIYTIVLVIVVYLIFSQLLGVSLP
ncbi:MAG: tripartite tricarboxylate transporter TctB family protein [Spirochaetia bacterium]|nr:tripartite tricarboxylate transporter TctB family protein [Spirochaetia bacterium]